MRSRPLTAAATALGTAVAGLLLVASPSQAIVDRDCGDFDSQRQAQLFFLRNGGPSSDPHRLDAEGDGVACESNPAPYYYGNSLPGSEPEPKVEQVRSSILLAVSRGRAITGEKLKLTARVKPRGIRSVVFQVRAGGRWKVVDRHRTSRRGKAVEALRAPRSSTRFRAVVSSARAGNKKLSKATSSTKRLRIERQTVQLTLSRTSVGQHGSVRGTAVASPVRRGRRLSLQLWRAGQWETVHTARESRRGRATFGVPTGVLGTHRFRAIALRHRGAEPHTSSSRRLGVEDRTAPATPGDVVTTPGDGQVSVSWTSVLAADLDHYDVQVRTAGTAWTTVARPSGTDHLVDGLLNGSTYWFRVRSVDVSGNPSAYSAEVSGTPAVPVE